MTVDEMTFSQQAYKWVLILMSHQLMPKFKLKNMYSSSKHFLQNRILLSQTTIYFRVAFSSHNHAYIKSCVYSLKISEFVACV